MNSDRDAIDQAISTSARYPDSAYLKGLEAGVYARRYPQLPRPNCTAPTGTVASAHWLMGYEDASN
jgi:hypothetical protein